MVWSGFMYEYLRISTKLLADMQNMSLQDWWSAKLEPGRLSSKMSS
jgi:hypothetical protein